MTPRHAMIAVVPAVVLGLTLLPSQPLDERGALATEPGAGSPEGVAEPSDVPQSSERTGLRDDGGAAVHEERELHLFDLVVADEGRVKIPLTLEVAGQKVLGPPGAGYRVSNEIEVPRTSAGASLVGAITGAFDRPRASDSADCGPDRQGRRFSLGSGGGSLEFSLWLVGREGFDGQSRRLAHDDIPLPASSEGRVVVADLCEQRAQAARTQGSNRNSESRGAPRPSRAAGGPRPLLRHTSNRRVVRRGQTVFYEITYLNRGESPARVRLCEVIPRHTTTIWATGSERLRRGRVCWRSVRVLPGRRVVRKIRLRIDRTASSRTIRSVAVARTRGVRTVSAKVGVRLAGRRGA